jgi:hypothetical protein
VLAQWQEQHREAVDRERTAMSWQEWRDDRVTQAAVAWVLTTVFVRFCEDNASSRRCGSPARLPASRRPSTPSSPTSASTPSTPPGSGSVRPSPTCAAVEATRDLVESHSPLWLVSPSGQAVRRRCVDFWRAKTTDDGHLVRDFTDPDLSTRFLGDLYQDLSDYAKKTFALLQTPEFVEEFILDQTMEPALAERPLEGFTDDRPDLRVRPLPPRRLRPAQRPLGGARPGPEPRARVQKAFDAVHGVDLNPFAVAIARFRLIVAALQACELTSLEAAPGFTVNLAAGDSLLHGSHQLAMQFDGFDADSQLSGFAYATEDLDALRRILTSRPLRRRRRQPALHHGQGQDPQRFVPRAVPDVQGHVCADRAVHGAVLRPGQAARRRPPGRVDRADHVELVHEARVRLPAHRGVPRQAGPSPRRRHLGGVHPRARHPDGHHRRPAAGAGRADGTGRARRAG